MLYRTMSEGRPATRIRSALPIATFVSVCGIGRTIFGDSKAVPHVVPRALCFAVRTRGRRLLRWRKLQSFLIRNVMTSLELATQEIQTPLGWHRRLLQTGEQSLAGLRRGAQQQNPRHPTTGLRPARRRVPSAQNTHLHAADALTPHPRFWLKSTHTTSRRPPKERPPCGGLSKSRLDGRPSGCGP